MAAMSSAKTYAKALVAKSMGRNDAFLQLLAVQVRGDLACAHCAHPGIHAMPHSLPQVLVEFMVSCGAFLEAVDGVGCIDDHLQVP